MPSNKKPLTTVVGRPGKLHADTATASALTFTAGGSDAIASFLLAVVAQELTVIRKTAGVVDTGQASYDIRLSGDADPIWVSDSGGTDLSDLFVVVFESNDAPVKKVSEASVTVASIAGASVGDGFTLADPLTLTFSTPLPNSGDTFCIYYAVQQTVSDMAVNSFSFPNVRQAQSVNPEVQRLMEELHADLGTQTWDAPWDASIETLASAGLDDRYSRSTVVGGAASGRLSVIGDANISDAETVTIDGKVYTFQNILTDVDGNVLNGATPLSNLRAAINLEGVPGTDYALSMTLHPTVTASSTAQSVFLKAKAGGVGGNAITTTETSAVLGFGGATLSGGVAFNYNLPGDGAVILREGRAPSSLATAVPVDYLNAISIDPFWASWLAGVSGADVTAAPAINIEGGTGFVSVASLRHTGDTNELSKPALTAGSFMSVYPRNIVADTLTTADVRTRIDPTNPASLNPDAGATDASRSTIKCGTNDFFINSSGNSEISRQRDLIKVSYTGALAYRADEVYVIQSVDSTTRVRVRTLSGAVPNFPTVAATTDCTIQFMKVGFSQGGGAFRSAIGTGDYPGTSMYHAVLPTVTDDPDTAERQLTAGEFIARAPRFLAAARTVAEYGTTPGAGESIPHALEWGGFEPAATKNIYTGALRGDGGVNTTILQTTQHRVVVSATSTTTWHPGIDGSFLQVEFTHGAGTITWTLEMDPDYDPEDGEHLEILLTPSASFATGAEVTIVWPTVPGVIFGFEDSNQVDELLLDRPVWYDATRTTLSTIGLFLVERRNRENITFAQKIHFQETHSVSPSGGGTIDWRPMVDGAFLTVSSLDNNNYTLNVIGEAGKFPAAGYELTILIQPAVLYNSTWTWPAGFVFSGTDEILSLNASDLVKFTGIYTAGGKAYFTRTDYPS